LNNKSLKNKGEQMSTPPRDPRDDRENEPEPMVIEYPPETIRETEPLWVLPDVVEKILREKRGPRKDRAN